MRFTFPLSSLSDWRRRIALAAILITAAYAATHAAADDAVDASVDASADAAVDASVDAADAASADAAAEAPVSFRADVAPILLDNCVSCHSAKKAEGGYRIDTFAELQKAGDSGEAPIDAAQEHAGELVRRMITDDESERMPEGTDPLPAESIAILKRWVAAGATFDGPNPDEALAFVVPPPRHIDPPQSYPMSVPVTAVAFSPDGNQLLVGGYHEITVWNIADGSLVRRIPNIGQRVFAITPSPDGATLAVACGEPGRSGEVRLIDFASGEVRGVVARSTDVALDVAYRPGSTQFAVASADSLVRIIDSQTLETVRTLAGHADWVTAVAWSPDGTRLISASRDKSAKVFESDSGELLTSYGGHGAAVRGVMFSADGTHAFSSGTDNQLHRWEVVGGKRIAAVPLGGEGYRISGTDAAVFVPSGDHRVLQIDLASNAIGKAFVGLTDWALAEAVHPASGRIAGGAFNGEVAVWDLATGDAIHRWQAKP